MCNFRSRQRKGSILFEQYNVIRRVNRAGGLIGLFKTQHHVVNDQVRSLNRDGYRVSFIVSDSWTMMQWLGAMVLLVLTLFLYTKSPGLLVVGERIETPNREREGSPSATLSSLSAKSQMEQDNVAL